MGADYFVFCKLFNVADTPLAQVKLGELGAWLGRRNKKPVAMAQAVSRGWFKGFNI